MVGMIKVMAPGQERQEDHVAMHKSAALHRIGE
jgi:hypothetical protein